MGISRDNTALRQAEEAQRRTEEQYGRIVETAHEGICLLDADGHITFANARVAELLGASVFSVVAVDHHVAAADRLEGSRQGLREQLVHVRRGALLHDIGKMGVPDAILLKPGPLTKEEWTIMRRHPTYAYEMLLPITYLRPALDIPYRHHEKWDGSGYPRGLKGEQIPLAARIFAAVDVYDALTSERPYRPAWSVDRTREHIRALAGSHFDPAVVEAFLALEPRP